MKILRFSCFMVQLCHFFAESRHSGNNISLQLQIGNLRFWIKVRDRFGKEYVMMSV